MLYALRFTLYLSLASSAFSQNIFYLTFHGTSYQTNASGNIAPVPITEQTMLQQAAQAGGVTDLSTLALVYHVQGSGFGDTIEVINRTTGAAYPYLLGFFFGEATSMTPDRTAITNATHTQVRRIDFVYTQQNNHSMGSGFLTKRFVTDGNGNPRATIDAKLQWIVKPEGTNGTAMCKGTFTTTKAYP
jgi:hypothetical protein